MGRFARGITLVELLVTVAILGVILALLAFPLMAGFGYLQRATAGREAQRVAQDGTRRIEREVGTAMYVADLPPDGSFVTVFLEADGGRGMAMNPGDQTVRVVRYARVPDFPWYWDATANTWKLLQPNYVRYVRDTNPAGIDPIYIDPIYEDYHSPFYAMQSMGSINPYVMARYESSTLTWTDAWTNQAISTLNGSFPMDRPTYTNVAANPQLARDAKREQLWRQYRNDYVAVTPYGQEWTVAGFRVSPLRMSTEALVPQVDADGARTTVYTSRYPLWAARSLDLDAVPEVTPANDYLHDVFGVDVDWLADKDKGGWVLYPHGVNPYGYEVRVFDRNGAMAYGWSEANKVLASQRHFMEWPPIGRPDLTDTGGDLNLTKAAAYGWRDEVMRQRLEGKLVFTQPFQAPEHLTLADGSLDPDVAAPVAVTTLPYPEGWVEELTYVTDLPQTLTVDLAGPTSFSLASHGDPAALRATEYCLAKTGTRKLAFGSRMPLGGTVDVQTPADLRIWMADIQTDDVVVATYATRSVLDISLTMARQNRAAMAGGVRQDYTSTIRVEARNATKRARGSQ